MSVERELLLRAYEVIRRGEIRIDADCSGESPLAQEIKAALAVPAPVEGEARGASGLVEAVNEDWWTPAMQAAARAYGQTLYRSDGYGYRVKEIIDAYERVVPVEREHEDTAEPTIVVNEFGHREHTRRGL